MQEAPAVIAVLFHSLYAKSSDIDALSFDPQQAVTVDEFRLFVTDFLEAGYTPVTPETVVDSWGSGKFLIVTFDDGYYNNQLAADVLAEFKAPATFFISSNHVIEGKSYWWDVVSRLAHDAGTPARERQRTIKRLKTWKTDRIEAHLTAQHGKEALRPRGDLDRPFTPQELKDFSRLPCVRIGNHTSDHAILTNYTLHEAALQIGDCQAALNAIVGYPPASFAYPNGNYSASIAAAVQQAGLSTAFTLRPRKNRLPLRDASMRLRLGRFILWGGRDIRRQCAIFRSELALGRYFRKLTWGYGS
jgi:peptidoglycan/xylan/chitin deacetylase (PgdA/CDA1 family)